MICEQFNDVQVREIIKREGGYRYTNDKVDMGGSTYAGITQAALNSFRKKHPNKKLPRIVLALNKEQISEIYTESYIYPNNYIVSVLVRKQAIDITVNSGESTAVKLIQKAAGIKADGVVGEQTKSVINSLDPVALNNALVKQRIMFLAKIIERKHSQAKFANGWFKRASDFYV